jgi:flagellar biosynthesis GTPase FlhF
MKIKRFEAQSMSEALRMVKKEFGENAVILSAANAKNSGKFFNPMGSRQVVVTAAIDMAPAKGRSASKVPCTDNHVMRVKENMSSQIDSLQERGSRILERFQPITKTGRKKLQPKLAGLMSGQPPAASLPCEPGDNLYDTLSARGLSSSIARDLSDQTTQLLTMADEDQASTEGTLAQVIAAKGWVASGLSLPSQKNDPLVLVGPHGAGKTAAAAKLAATCMLNGLGTPEVISVDHQRAAATQELERLARIMGIPLHVAVDQGQLARIYREIGNHGYHGYHGGRGPVIIDTPGISPSAAMELEALDEMLKPLERAQVHLVVNASLQGKAIRKTIDFFRPLGVSRLLFTQLDCLWDVGPMINQVETSLLPMAYLSNGPQVPDGLLRATPAVLAKLLLEGHTDQDQEDDELPVTVVTQPEEALDPRKYVANCNSDIFHDVSCRSVARMNQDHILTFDNAQDALSQGFHPCRMCCLELYVPKSNDRLLRTRQTYRQQAL